MCVCVCTIHVDLDAFIMSGFANIDIHASEDINKNSGHPTTAVGTINSAWAVLQ